MHPEQNQQKPNLRISTEKISFIEFRHLLTCDAKVRRWVSVNLEGLYDVHCNEN